MSSTRTAAVLSTMSLLARPGVGGCSQSGTGADSREVPALGSEQAEIREIRASSYDQSCLTAGDCVAVVGGKCGPCGNPCDELGAISASAATGYKSAYTALSCESDGAAYCQQCPYSHDSGLFVPDERVPDPSVACEAGRCIARACASDEVRAMTCVECSPVDECLRTETGCLKKCTSDDACPLEQTCLKDAGYCAFVCL
jgi:hypothetical protein